MGISGLLPALKSIQKERHIKHWAGKTVAVDGYGWLHRGTISCAVELALGKPTAKYVDFAMGRVKMLLHYGVTPYLVFDGDYLPSKAGEESERAARREVARKAGLELLKQGKSSQAYLELQKAIDVTPQMARHFIDALIEAKIQYVVAPYEADAQMFYLERMGVVDAIISEDSDLLVFGCKNLITKLSQFGECIDICREDFTKCKEMSFAGWTDAEFRCMAILSGCDYLENIPRMGLKTAHRLIRKHRTIDRIIRAIRFDAQYNVPIDYLENFRRADLTFQHQRVYCPIAKRMVMCTEPQSSLTDEELIFIGPEIEEEIAQKVASGELHPMTKEPLILGVAKDITKKASWASPKHTVQQASSKPSTTLLSFFKPTASMQQKKMSCKTDVSKSKPVQTSPLIKRKSSLTHDDDAELSKRPKFPNKPEGSTPREERSKFFQTPKHKQSRRDLSPFNTMPKPRLVHSVGSGKENAVPKTPVRSVNEKEKLKAAPKQEEDEVLKIVAQGWRERYSLKSATLDYISAHGRKQTPSKNTFRTPLQRIGANALQRPSGPAHRTTSTFLRTAKGPNKPTTSVQNVPANSLNSQSQSESTDVDSQPSDVAADDPLNFSFDKFLYTPS